REQGDRRVAGVGDGNRHRREQPKQDTKDGEQDGDDDYLHRPHQDSPRTPRLRREFAGAPLRGFAASSRGPLFWRKPLICLSERATATAAVSPGLAAAEPPP